MRKLAGLAVAIVLVLPAAAGADGERVLLATVGPGFDISLTDTNGAAVTHLDPGTYTVQVDDRAPLHDFMLRGPGVRESTSYEFVGHTAWTVTFQDGYYRFYCSPHEGDNAEDHPMRGQFTVGTPPPPTLKAVVTNSSISLTDSAGAAVQQLSPGKYSLTVEDRSDREDFRLFGPGLEEHTQVHTIDSELWTVSLTDGHYSYYSERSARSLNGRFTVGTPSGPPDPNRLTGIVGPDFTITLVDADFAPVTTLPAGRYSIAVEDTSDVHNFHLGGPGFTKPTGIDFVGHETWEANLSPGSYTVQCDPHFQVMRFSFQVTGTSRKPKTRVLNAAVSSRGRVSLTPTATRAGAVRLVVHDNSRAANFHLRGPSVNRKTGLGFRGTTSWRLVLKPATYRYGSDRSGLRGRLKVS